MGVYTTGIDDGYRADRGIPPCRTVGVWCHDLVEISRKLRKLLTDLFMLLIATNNENERAIFEMITEEAE